jgi:hypothetical protein
MGEGGFDLLLDWLQVHRALLDETDDASGCDLNSQQIAEHLTGSDVRQELILHQIDGERLDGGTIVNWSAKGSRKRGASHVPALGALLLFQPFAR